MFTGIIETIGHLKETRKSGSNLDMCFSSGIGNELSIDQSVSHNGVCLTVIDVKDDHHWVTAVNETLERSNLGDLNTGDQVNLERCMKADGRFDGHIVQGHVDTTGKVKTIHEKDGSWLFEFTIDDGTKLIVEKGSICVNGVSLTCFDISENNFAVAIIPYTYEHTNFNQLKKGSVVNIEYDIVGKYISKLLKNGGT